MPSSNNTERALFYRARAWAGEITKTAKRFAPNSRIRSAIKSKVERAGLGKYIIRVIVDKTIAPEASALEYGSGIHSRLSRTSKYQLGVRGKIEIKPKTKKALAFFWEKADPSKHTILPDGRVLFPRVEHPGVEAANRGRGYIAPAIKEVKKRGKDKLSAELRQAILADIRSSFKHAS